MQFSEVIKQLRKRSGISQQRLAEKLKLSYPTINRWENSKFDPNPRISIVVRDYIKTLGKDYTDLLVYFSDAEAQKRIAGSLTAETAEVGDDFMGIKDMESMLWQAACSIRGEKDAPKFKDYILPLLFIKRLSDVFEDEIARLVKDCGDEKSAREIIEADHTMGACPRFS